MTESERIMVERLFDAFNRRDVEGIAELCDEDIEFLAVTAQIRGRSVPYRGPDGLRTYLDDVTHTWEELLILPKRVESRGSRLLVGGRVYLRSRELGIRDMPAAWIWELRNGRFVRGQAFADPEQASARFLAAPD